MLNVVILIVVAPSFSFRLHHLLNGRFCPRCKARAFCLYIFLFSKDKNALAFIKERYRHSVSCLPKKILNLVNCISRLDQDLHYLSNFMKLLWGMKQLKYHLHTRFKQSDFNADAIYNLSFFQKKMFKYIFPLIFGLSSNLQSF